MRRRTGPLLLLLLPLVIGAARPLQAQVPPSRTLTVTASAEVRATPDRAVVQLGVSTRAANALAAMTQNNTVVAQVIAALKQLGIPETSMQTAVLNLQPIYEPSSENPNAPPRLVAFEASNILSVELMEMARVAPTIDAAVTAGANQIQGISFRVANEESVRLTALREAVSRARPKAEAIAAAAGVTLGDVDAIVEIGRSVVPLADAQAIGGSTPVLPGTVAVGVEVQVRYLIR